MYGCGHRGHADKGHVDGWREGKRCRRQAAIEEDHLFWCPHKGTCQTWMKRKAPARPKLIYGLRDQTQTDKCALRMTMDYGG